ncbi:MAG: undecaprenyldiphospho-muramoylpentapeptide beta-N-acetylglucosaminyltransferase [Candidatus Omnitrophica bacterium]|nr:undecaprenyldiphospho-muramoylpentapeptide beta-N-acetylglucosaminyltransferase [Candidatus Omnitrophota bacterium]
MRVLVATGASGGHIFPALSFLYALREKDKGIDSLLVLPERGIRSQIAFAGYTVKYLPIYPIKLRLDSKNLAALFAFIKSFFLSLSILIKFKPDIVVGFGSIDSVPMVMLAWLFRIRTLIHEQNVIPGKANRLLAKFADKIAISFAETKDYLHISPDRICFTGNPIRPELKRLAKKEALDFFGFNEEGFTILVVGGSQGSHTINMAFLGALSIMQPGRSLQVIHISGNKDLDLLSERYKLLSANVKPKLFAFLKEMQYAYSASDLVVSRAGATTIAELINFSLPAVIIPYPFAYKHQSKNADILKRNGCAEVIEEDALSAEGLKEALDKFINNGKRIESMRSNYNNKFRSNAADLLVKEALSLN